MTPPNSEREKKMDAREAKHGVYADISLVHYMLDDNRGAEALERIRRRFEAFQAFASFVATRDGASVAERLADWLEIHDLAVALLEGRDVGIPVRRARFAAHGHTDANGDGYACTETHLAVNAIRETDKPVDRCYCGEPMDSGKTCCFDPNQ